jgi:hypothetical protein
MNVLCDMSALLDRVVQKRRHRSGSGEEVHALENFTHHPHMHRYYYIINCIINLQDLSEKIASNIQNTDKDMDFSRFFPLKYPNSGQGYTEILPSNIQKSGQTLA